MAQTARLMPRLYVGYLISEGLKKHKPNKWEEALKWDLDHPPRTTGNGNDYGRSTIIYSGE